MCRKRPVVGSGIRFLPIKYLRRKGSAVPLAPMDEADRVESGGDTMTKRSYPQYLRFLSVGEQLVGETPRRNVLAEYEGRYQSDRDKLESMMKHGRTTVPGPFLTRYFGNEFPKDCGRQLLIGSTRIVDIRSSRTA
jgi:hypothetical protein